jgi:hypothetical protein
MARSNDRCNLHEPGGYGEAAWDCFVSDAQAYMGSRVQTCSPRGKWRKRTWLASLDSDDQEPADSIAEGRFQRACILSRLREKNKNI